MKNIILQNTLKRLGKSPTRLTKQNVSKIKELFPIPIEYQILWADVRFSNRISGLVITDKALIIKADKETVKSYNEACTNKKDKRDSIYHLIHWEYVSPDDFKFRVGSRKTTIFYAGSAVLSTPGYVVSNVFRFYKDETEKFTKEAILTSTGAFSDFESVVPANFAKVNTKTGHGEMAEEALTLMDKLKGKNAKVVGRDNAKNGPDRIVDGIWIQTKYCATGAKCIESCFDKTTGTFRYFNPDGSPMQIEVPSNPDMYTEAINTFRNKILEGKVPGVSNPDDAALYIRKGKLTYQQALNLCKPGTIESLTYDAATGAVYCSFALGISFLSTYIICYTQTGDKNQALNEAVTAGIQVFGLSFLGHVLASQVARTNLTKQLIPISTQLVKSLGFKTTQNIVNSVRAMSGKAAISGSAATKQLAKILRSNVVTSVAVFAVFSVPDTYNMFAKQISGAQYTKNMLSLAGSMASAGGGTLATSLGAAKIAAATGTTIAPGVGTAIGLCGGLAGGLIGGTAIQVIGDQIREDDSVILSRMFNGILLNLIYEYMLQDSEVKALIEKLNSIKKKDFKGFFRRLLKSEKQEEEINRFVRHYFEEIIRKRPHIAAPTEEEIAALFAELYDDAEDGTERSEMPEL